MSTQVTQLFEYLDELIRGVNAGRRILGENVKELKEDEEYKNLKNEDKALRSKITYLKSEICFCNSKRAKIHKRLKTLEIKHGGTDMYHLRRDLEDGEAEIERTQIALREAIEKEEEANKENQ